MRAFLGCVLCGISLLIGGAAFGAGEWVSLFDGKSLNGWKTLPGGKWEVRDGIIVGVTPRSEERHGILYTEKDYTDFEASVVYRAVKGNSGFFFRSAEYKKTQTVEGFQAEIDADGRNAGGLYENWGRNWVVRPPRPLIQKAFKKGEWNQMTVRAEGHHITVFLNGYKMSELKNDKRSRLKGFFGFQLHGRRDMSVEVKEVKVKEL